jgi:AcrR family transcriptional regulator
MGLLEEQKAERRARILAAARRLIAEEGYDGFSMRTLAAMSRVSVPTLYNQFGSKHALLAALMQEQFGEIARAFDEVAPGDTIARAAALQEVGLRSMLAVPGFYRELVHVMLSTPETDQLRREVEEQYIAVMAGNLRAGQAAGELADWFDPDVLARQLYVTMMMAVLGWARGDLDDEGFLQAAAYGQCMLLLGVARGDGADRLMKRARSAEKRFQHVKRR